MKKLRKPRPFKSKHEFPISGELHYTIGDPAYIKISFEDQIVQMISEKNELSDFRKWIDLCDDYFKQQQKGVK